MADLNLIVQLIGDQKSLDKGIKTTTGRISGMGRSIAKLGAGLGLAIGAKEAIDWMGDAADKAIELEEAQNKVDVVFGNSSAGVRDWANSLDAAYGVSIRQATKAVGTFGQIAKAMGLNEAEAADYSAALVEMAGDIASFSNITVEDALERLRSGLTGEFEPLKAIGGAFSASLIKAKALSEGLIEQGEVLGNREKTLAYQALLVDQFGDAIGDAANTQDTAAGKSRVLTGRMDNLQTSFGESIAPIKEAALQLGIFGADVLSTAITNGQDIAYEIGNIATGLAEVTITADEAGDAFAYLDGVSDPQGFLELGLALGFTDEQMQAFSHDLVTNNELMDLAYNKGKLQQIAVADLEDEWAKAGATLEQNVGIMRSVAEWANRAKDSVLDWKDGTEQATDTFVISSAAVKEFATNMGAIAEATKWAGNTIMSWFGGSSPVKDTLTAFWESNEQQLKNARYLLNPENIKTELANISTAMRKWKQVRKQAQADGNKTALALANQQIRKMAALRYQYTGLAKDWWGSLTKQTRKELNALRKATLASLYSLIAKLRLIMRNAGIPGFGGTSTSTSSYGTVPSVGAYNAPTSGGSAGVVNVTMNITGDAQSVEQSVVSALQRFSSNNGAHQPTPYGNVTVY